MLVSFLFWNLRKSPLQARLASIVSLHKIDVVILAECVTAPADIEAALKQATGQDYFYFPALGGNHKIHIFSSFAKSAISDQFNDATGRLTICRLQLDSVADILLAVVHFPSRVNSDADDQTLEATQLANDIIIVERDTKISRTILVGDLNMNPFDPGVSGAAALHAVMAKQLAERGERIVQGRTYRFFYNPMWGYFGDRTTGPSGTYYFSSSRQVNHFWNMYDQVLLRPELMHTLRELRILEWDGVDTLITRNGIPNSLTGSDHLPLFFSLEL